MSESATKVKWVPGPWKAFEFRVMAYDAATGMHSRYICDTANNHRTRINENAANARMIAKAPEMAELLRELYEHAAMQEPVFAKLEALLAEIE